MEEICIRKKCKDCPKQIICFGCEHNYILIKTGTATNEYKCTRCGRKIRRNKNEN